MSKDAQLCLQALLKYGVSRHTLNWGHKSDFGPLLEEGYKWEKDTTVMKLLKNGKSSWVHVSPKCFLSIWWCTCSVRARVYSYRDIAGQTSRVLAICSFLSEIALWDQESSSTPLLWNQYRSHLTRRELTTAMRKYFLHLLLPICSQATFNENIFTRIGIAEIRDSNNWNLGNEANERKNVKNNDRLWTSPTIKDIYRILAVYLQLVIKIVPICSFHVYAYRL